MRALLVSAGNLYADSPSITRALDAFRQSQVDLTEDDYMRGRKLASQIISMVAAQASQHSHLPRVYVSESFLAGSLGRRTQERPLDDIDLYLVVNAGGLFMSPDGYTVPLTLYGSWPNPLATDPRYVNDHWVSSFLMLNAFYSPVAEVALKSGAVVGFSAKRKTLHLTWSDLNVDLGFVAWGQAEGLASDRYYLPKGQSQHWWSRTNPKVDQQRLTDRNKAGAGKLLPLIRIMKWWNRHRNKDRLKGIHLEVMMENAFLNVAPYPLFPALCHAFLQLRFMLDQSCPDPNGLGDPSGLLAIAGNWKRPV